MDFKFKIERVNHIQALGDFKEGVDFELITTAKQTDPRYGNFRYKKEDLQEMADNFNDNVVGTEIAVDLNHDPEGIALGWIKTGSMHVGKSSRLEGQYSLFAKLHNFTPKGKELIKTGAVKYFSIEIQHKFEKFVGEVKKIFKNVIRGLALTNRPVIKDMMPTFSEVNLKLSENKNMEAYKILLSQLKGQEVVSLSEKGTIKKMFATLNEDEQKEVKADTEAVEAKPEEKKEGETEEEKTLRETKEAEVKKLEEEKDLTEIKKELNETKKQADKALSDLRKRDLNDIVSPMLLSDSKKELSFGFASDKKEDLVNFCMTLSADQMAVFSGLWSTVKAVDFSEKGIDGDGKIFDKKDSKFGEDGKTPIDEDSQKLDNEVKAYAEKNKVSYEVAYEKVAETK